MRRAPLTRLAQDWIAATLSPGDTALDATVGNGHDTLFLARCVSPGGRVWGLDIQPQALVNARQQLEDVRDCTVELVLRGHEHLDRLDTGPLQAAMFNLGYLPGADHTVTTLPATTCRALDHVAVRLAAGGRCSVLAYVGHAGGTAEADAVRRWCETLPQAGFRWRFANPPETPESAPRLYLIERR